LTLACIVSADATGKGTEVHLCYPAWALLAVDVSLVIKHYAAKARIEPNHKIDSAV